MAANNLNYEAGRPDALQPESDPAIAALIAKASDVELDELAPPPFRRPQPNNIFWRGVDFVGCFAAPLGGLITLLVFLVGVLGGPDYAWVSFFYLLSLLLFIIFIPAFLRKERRAREARYTQARATQAHLKMEIARKLLQQEKGEQQ